MGTLNAARLNVPPFETGRLFITDIRNATDTELVKFLSAQRLALLDEHLQNISGIYAPMTEADARKTSLLSPLGSDLLIFEKLEDGTRKPIGRLKLFGHEADSIRISPFILPERRDKGFAAEAFEGIMSALRNAAGINRLYAEVEPENHAMIRLLKKLGANALGEATPLVPYPDKPIDMRVQRYEIDFPIGRRTFATLVHPSSSKKTPSR